MPKTRELPDVRVGQRWQENDPRSGPRIVRVTEVHADARPHPYAVIECEPQRPRGRATRARLARFNGKRGGYSLIEA